VSAIGSHRQTSPNNLPKAGQIRTNFQEPLRASVRQPETGDNLVKDQECTMFPCQFAQPLKKSPCRKHGSHIAGNRFNDYSRYFRSVQLKDLPNSFAVIIGNGNRGTAILRLNTGAVRQAEGCNPGSGFNQQTVDMPVIAPVEFDDFVAPGKSPGQSDGAHGRLSAGIHQSHLLDGRMAFVIISQ
jgi:hypothetical protein